MSFPRPFGRYVLEERIALGGMAEIFRARTRAEGFAKRICIKRILPSFLDSTDFVTMFRDEAALAARLTHANVVQVFDFGEQDGSLFLAMEFVEGADLRTLIKAAKSQGVRFPIGQAVQIAIEMCRGLQYAHSLFVDGMPLHIVHRDISPHNVLLSESGEVKITDFGIAKAAARSTHTGTGVIKGKLAYMAPEQIRAAELDHRVDLFATGIVLWEMLTGTRLYQAEDEVALFRQVLACEIPAPSTLRNDVPTELDQILLRCLAAEPDARFADMRAFENALSRFLYAYTQDPEALDIRNLVRRFLPPAKPTRKTAVLPAPAENGLRPTAEAQPHDQAAGIAEAMQEPRTASVFTKGVDSLDGTTDADAEIGLGFAADTTVPERPSSWSDTASSQVLEPSRALPTDASLSSPEDTTETGLHIVTPTSPTAEIEIAAASPLSHRERVADTPNHGAHDNPWRFRLRGSLALIATGLGFGFLLSASMNFGGGPGDQQPPSGDEVRAPTPASAAIGAEPSAPASSPTPASSVGAGIVPRPPPALEPASSPTPPPAVEPASAPVPPPAMEPAPAPVPTSSAPASLEKKSSPKAARAAPRPTGDVWIKMRKGWARVYLGKARLCDETPCLATLPVGVHELIFESSYDGRFTQKVRLRAGRTTEFLAGKPQE